MYVAVTRIGYIIENYDEQWYLYSYYIIYRDNNWLDLMKYFINK